MVIKISREDVFIARSENILIVNIECRNTYAIKLSKNFLLRSTEIYFYNRRFHQLLTSWEQIHIFIVVNPAEICQLEAHQNINTLKIKLKPLRDKYSWNR